jgi:hypothetical protein
MLQLNETLENGFIGLVVSLVGTYLIAVRKGAEAIDTAWGAEYSALRKQVEQLTPPKRTLSEEHHYNEAKAALETLGAKAIVLLRHLKKHGELTFIAPQSIGSPGPPYTQSPLPEGLNVNETYVCLGDCARKSLVTPVHRTVSLGPNYTYPAIYIDYRIAEGMKEALDELLYQPSSGGSGSRDSIAPIGEGP